MKLYLFGVLIAAILIGRDISKRYKDDEEFSGNILCYLFALLSWGTVLIILITKIFKHGSK
jgi:hypothetical protein